MSRHHHLRSTDKGKRKRAILSFVLFVSIVLFSLSFCGKNVIFNVYSIEEAFLDSQYISAIQSDVIEYGEDLCKQNSIPSDFIPNTIRYNTILEIEKSYLENALDTSDTYNDYAYGVLIEQLNADIKNGASQAIKYNGIKVDSPSRKTGAEDFALNVTEYVQKRVELPFWDNLYQLTQKCNKICLVLLILTGLLIIGSIIAIACADGKGYRKFRNCAVSFVSASLFDAIMLLVVALVCATKDLVLYPSYAAQGLMRCVYASVASVGITSLALLFVALVLMAAVWSMKRNERE